MMEIEDDRLEAALKRVAGCCDGTCPHKKELELIRESIQDPRGQVESLQAQMLEFALTGRVRLS